MCTHLSGCPTCGWTQPAAAPPHVCSPINPDNDPLLSVVFSYLASHPRSSGSGAAALARGRSGGSGAYPLSPETQMWQVEWGELQIRRPVGRGSFGAVYEARWQETAVAVKLLFNKGECWPVHELCAGQWGGCQVRRRQRAARAAPRCTRGRPFDHTSCSALLPRPADDLSLQQGGLELPENTMRELQAEAAVMVRMR